MTQNTHTPRRSSKGKPSLKKGQHKANPNIGNSRKVAVQALCNILDQKQGLDQAITMASNVAKLSPRDRAFVVQLVTTTLRRYGSLLSTIDYMLERPLDRRSQDVQVIIMTGLTQIFFMRTDDHAAVNETVNLLHGKRQRFRGITNALLRRAIRERDDLIDHMDQSATEDLPHWLAASWNQTYGTKVTEAIAKSLRTPPMTDITVKKPEDQKDLALELDADILPTGNLRLKPTDVTALSGYDQGGWWVQDVAASLPAMLFRDVTDKTVVDFCAAPGGKTMQLAAMGANVVAVDRSKPRLKRLHANLKRTWLKAKVIVADALEADLSDHTIDHILLDAPCSATGTLRRNPDLMWCKGADDIQSLLPLQADLLDHAFALLPVGGTLVYCVCSLEAAEGIHQIESFLDRTPKAKRQTIKPEDISDSSELLTEDGDLLCLPSLWSERGGMDGFFAARLTKTA